MIADSLLYPVRRDGLIMIILGTIFSVFLDVGKHVPVMGLAVAVFSSGYFAAFYFDIVGSTVTGKDEVPEWPSFSDYWDDIILPYFQIIFVAVISFSLVGVVFFTCNSKEDWFAGAIAGAIAFGLLYFPMAVLGLVMFGSIKGSLPHIVLPAIFKGFPGYLTAVAALLFALAIEAAAGIMTSNIPIVGTLVTTAVSLYALMFQARLFGLVYLSIRERLAWE